MRHLPLPSLALLLALSACGDPSTVASGGAPREELRRAAEAMLALESFQADVTAGDGSGESPGVVIYQAPDRSLSRFEDGTETITIGQVGYFSLPDRPGYYDEVSLSQEEASDGLLGLLLLVGKAEDVRREGETYPFSLRDTGGEEAGSGQATITEGLLHSLTFRYEPVPGEVATMTLFFSRFNSAPPIRRPPSDRILEDH